MQNTLLLILQSCDTIKELNNEFNKSFGFLMIKQKHEYKELKEKVIEKINSLKDDKWTVSYLHSLEETFLAYRLKLTDFMNDNFYIQDFDSKDFNPIEFKTMYFSDNKENRIITLDISGHSINITIMDTNCGNTLSVSSENEIQENQKKIEAFCKQKIIDMLISYLEGTTKTV